MSANKKPSLENLKTAKRILKESPLIDSHNDLPWIYRKYYSNDVDAINLKSRLDKNSPYLFTDIVRMREGMVGATVFAAFIRENVPGQNPVKACLEQIDLIHRLAGKYSDRFAYAETPDDIIRIHKSGKIACLIGIEGGHALDESLAALRMYHRCGARYLTIAYLKNNPLCDSATEAPIHNGLSKFGEKVVREMNRLGMLIDLSHASPKTAHDSIDISNAPVIFSHSGAYSINPHPRNVPDDLLMRLKDNGGVAMLTFVSEFISREFHEYKARYYGEQKRLENIFQNEPEVIRTTMKKWEEENPGPVPDLDYVIRHLERFIDVAGIDHVGFGSDFEGFDTAPKGMEDVSCYLNLIAELIGRGYHEKEIKKIAGQNFLRAMRAAQNAAQK